MTAGERQGEKSCKDDGEEHSKVSATHQAGRPEDTSRCWDLRLSCWGSPCDWPTAGSDLPGHLGMGRGAAEASSWGHSKFPADGQEGDKRRVSLGKEKKKSKIR